MGTASRELPLLGDAPLDAPIAWRAGCWISRAEFLAHAGRLARELPPGGAAVNLCGDRYHFMVALAALLVRGTTALLPPSAAPRTVSDIAAAWHAFTIDDALVEAAAPGAARADRIPAVDARRPAVVLFTSGSTGHPTPQAKDWAELSGSTRVALQRFALDGSRRDLIATVPAQHSYGFESSVLYAMLGPATIHAGQPLYPADVQAALAAVSAPRVLVTTPVHLSAFVRAGLEWPATERIISATAPLERSIAQAAEETFGAPVYEIYGCSEAGALASRRTCRDIAWLPYEGVALRESGDDAYAHARHLPQPRKLGDIVAIGADGRFELRGRKADQIKVAGKRITLAELNRRLLEIDGVEDGSFVVPEDSRRGRLAAVVVAPDLPAEQIRARLAESLDPVFLPRPLVRVPVLERNATGKLTRAAILDILRERAGPASLSP